MSKIFYTLIFSWLLLTIFSLATHAQSNFILNWSTETYTPADYLGKPLAIADSQIKLDILPVDSTVRLSNFKYRWFINNKFHRLTSEPRTSFFAADINNYKIEVRILDQNDIVIDSKIIFVPIKQPEIILSSAQFFDPGRETQSDADDLIKMLSNYQVIAGDKLITYENASIVLTLWAKPYFLNVRSMNDLSYFWAVDNTESQTSKREDILWFNLAKSLPNRLSVNVKNDITGQKTGTFIDIISAR